MLRKLKKTAAIALLAITTSVSAEVEVYGLLRMYAETDKVGTDTSVTALTNDLSRLGFKGTEDLGKGLSVFYQVETGVSPDSPTPAAMGDRISWLGFKNQFGQVALGRNNHLIQNISVRYDAMGNSYGSSFTSIHDNNAARLPNAVYLEASPVKNIKLHYQHSASENADQSDAVAYGGEFKFGVINAAVARIDNRQSATKKRASNIVGVRADVTKGVTLFVLSSEDSRSLTETSGNTVGARYKLTPATTLLASVGKRQNVDAHSLGATYDLSKRTKLHVRYVKIDDINNTRDRQRFGLGVEHRF